MKTLLITTKAMNTERTEIDLLDVIKSRVEAGEPVFITGNSPVGIVKATEKFVADVAVEVGKPAKIVQIVDFDAGIESN